MNRKKQEHKNIELFAGAGGLALGLENVGLTNIFLVEIDKHCVDTLRSNKPTWNIIHVDICNVDFSGMDADVVTGGFPCQPFSYAGMQLGLKDPRGHLFFEFVRCIKEVKPKIFVCENVEGLVWHSGGDLLKRMLKILVDLGYTVQYQVLNAQNYAVPQKRKRLFIVGTKGGVSFKFPKQHKNILTLKGALKDVPSSPRQRYSKRRKEILSHVPVGGCWIDLPIEYQKEYMGKDFFSTNGGRRSIARRLSWNKPCPTLTTSPTQKRTDMIHPDETRPLTIREYARIQTFPDEWIFRGSISSQYKQIGNAVPVRLAEKIGRSIIETLDE